MVGITMNKASERRTLGPVTVGGWYENVDGSVTEYVWRAGSLCEGKTVPGWEDVEAAKCIGKCD